MRVRDIMLPVARWSLVAGMLASVPLTVMPTLADSVPAVGTVASTANATVDGVPLFAGATIFRGSTFELKKGGTAMVLVGGGTSIKFGGVLATARLDRPEEDPTVCEETVASVHGNPDRPVVLLTRGNVVISQPGGGQSATVQVKVGDATVETRQGTGTVVMVATSGQRVVVSALQGLSRVQVENRSINVNGGQTIVLTTDGAKPFPSGGGGPHYRLEEETKTAWEGGVEGADGLDLATAVPLPPVTSRSSLGPTDARLSQVLARVQGAAKKAVRDRVEGQDPVSSLLEDPPDASPWFTLKAKTITVTVMGVTVLVIVYVWVEVSV